MLLFSLPLVLSLLMPCARPASAQQDGDSGSYPFTAFTAVGASNPGPYAEDYYASGASCGTAAMPQECDSNSGDVTATFTWSGPGTAPPAIVEQDSSATWFAFYCAAAPDGTCADGLGDPAVPLVTDQAKSYGATSSGVSYSLGTPQGGVVTSTLSGAGTSVDPLTMLQWGWDAFGYRVDTDSWPTNGQTVGTDIYDGQTNNPPYPTWNQKFGSG